MVLLVHGQHSRNSERDAAVARARQIITDYSNYDYTNADKEFAHLATEFTGSLKSTIQQDLNSVVSLIKAGKGTAKGSVRYAGVTFQHGSKITVVAVVDQTVSNTAIPKGTLRRYRFSIVVQKVHGQWYGTALEQI